ncbi:glycosyltransferase [Pontibacter sp. H249]|uniref:glycosyltransferase n=1 Tax=Pontibacter sp. H249 TaxID=3133420 RepID=UPI0030C1EF25
MIFVTIGAQEPFERLVQAIDQIAPTLGGIPIVAQISKSSFQPKHMQVHEFLSPSMYTKYFNKATLIVSHAGMGTIISALVQQKPILVFPRLAKYGETRNDHQVSTAKVFEKLEYITAAYSEEELELKLKLLLQASMHNGSKIGKYASPDLIKSLKGEL